MVIQRKKTEQYYQNKRKEFVKFIDEALQTDWFVMPGPNTWVSRTYHDNWN